MVPNKQKFTIPWIWCPGNHFKTFRSASERLDFGSSLTGKAVLLFPTKMEERMKRHYIGCLFVDQSNYRLSTSVPFNKAVERLTAHILQGLDAILGEVAKWTYGISQFTVWGHTDAEDSMNQLWQTALGRIDGHRIAWPEEARTAEELEILWLTRPPHDPRELSFWDIAQDHSAQLLKPRALLIMLCSTDGGGDLLDELRTRFPSHFSQYARLCATVGNLLGTARIIWTEKPADSSIGCLFVAVDKRQQTPAFSRVFNIQGYLISALNHLKMQILWCRDLGVRFSEIILDTNSRTSLYISSTALLEILKGMEGDDSNMGYGEKITIRQC
ncbi:hypothetical protein QBC35DRAFT_182117 [Podospora australis]|uniref:Uncharacterized protein n=1 Tax=Podospora australis TaxID=1536484 RepID=A0AAN6WVB6_9PEZI|nr:hypothetical protein QBC35DRAFT_182117 [Podospora australis]